MLVILCRSLTLLAGFPAAALLLAGLRGRRLILLPRLALVRHAVSFHGNARTTARRSGSFLIKKNAARNAADYVSLTYSGLPFVVYVFSRQQLNAALRCDRRSVIPRANALSSAITIRTHKHRPTNKRELLFRSNHSRRARLIQC
jgi:hypothetical protein